MAAPRRLFARAATVGLLTAGLVTTGAPEQVAAEPVTGFEVAELVADFETMPAGTDWNDDSVVVGDHVYLMQDTPFDDPDGRRLWEYHPASGAVRRVDVSAVDYIDAGAVDYFGELAFSASRSDGAGGTEYVLLKLTPGGVPTVVKAFPEPVDGLAAGADALYFSVGDAALWSSGLTEVSTIEVATGLSQISGLTPAPRGDGIEIVYFSAGGASGEEPHRYDPGTGVTVYDVVPGAASSQPGEFYIVAGAAYFRAGSSGLDLYRLEGAVAASITPELLQTDVGAMTGSGRRVFVSYASGAVDVLAYYDHDADGFVTVVADFPFVVDGFALGPSGALLAVAPDAGESAVWFTDGTTGGTVEVRTTAPLALPSSELHGGPDEAGLTALFAADDGTGERVWRYSTFGTLNSIDPSAFAADFSANDLTFVVSAQAGQWVFPAADDEVGLEPFDSRGTTATTAPIGDLTPGNDGSGPRRFAAHDAGVDFTVSRSTTPTPEDLIAVDANGVAATIDLGLDPADRLREFVREPSGSFLVVVDRGRENWLVRSTAGTVSDLAMLGDDEPLDIVLSGDRLFFERRGIPRDRVASIRIDGTDLQELGVIGFEGAIAYAGGIVFESVASVTGGQEPWFSDGTVAGTGPLGDLRAGTGSFPAPFFELDGLVYFADGLGRTWVTDGTPGGTIGAWSGLEIDELAAIGDDGVLARDGRDLFFVTSAAGDVQPIAVPTYPNAPLYQFWQERSATSHAVSVALDGGVTWIGVVDGDEYRATEFALGPNDRIDDAVAHRGVALFVVNRDDARQEIIRTDGTAAGTGVVWDQLSAADGINELVLGGNRVFFDGWTEEFGEEVWSFDLGPLAPTGVTATAGNAVATVSWVAPTSTGSLPISGFTVSASPGGAGCATTGATSCVVTGLANGTAYTFTVTTTSEATTSAPSAPSAPVVPRAPVPPVPPLPDIATVVPSRLLDTRPTGETVDDRFEKTGRMDAGDVIELEVRNRGGVTADAAAVVLNVTMIRPDGNGFVTVYPCGDRPLASSMNAPTGGGVVANEVIAKVSANGTVCLYSSVATNLAADVTGFVPVTSDVVSLDPARLLDTRPTGETADGLFQQAGKVAADSFIELDVAGREGVPDAVGSVVLNVTMIRPDGNGFVTIYPCGDRPLASSMNAPTGGGVVANEVIAKVSPTGTVCLYTSIGTNLAADITGYVTS